MGADRRRRGPAAGGSRPLTRAVPAARVVPAVPTFSVDGGFWYSIPDSHAARVDVGTIVRIPLGGRTVRGYVVEVGERDPDRLKAVAGVSGDMGVFDTRLRDALVWAAHHYVAPVSVALERATPPNLPTIPPGGRDGRSTSRGSHHVLEPVVRAALTGRRRPVTALLAPWDDMTWVEALAPLPMEERSVMVVVATAAEARLLAEAARSVVGAGHVVEVSGELSDAEITGRWSTGAHVPGRLVVGTPRLASWPVAGLALSVVLEEGRRAMKDRQTPTVSVRRLLATRSRLEGFAQVYVGPTPSLDLLADGPEILSVGTRAWPLVEVVDRTEEPPGSGLVSPRVRTAMRLAAEEGRSVFVFTHRRGYAPAFRCARCRELRRCRICGSRPEPGEACPRCGAPSEPCAHCGGTSFEALGAGVGRVLQELGASMGDLVGEPDDDRPVVVGTERDLAAVAGVDLAVAVDVDGLTFGSHFRAAEEALRVLARLAGRVRRRTGNRMIVQTSLPEQAVVAALRRGDPREFARVELAARAEMGYPPSTEMLVVDVRAGGEGIDGDLREIADESVSVMGPADTHESRRWLVQGPGLGGFKLALRPLVQRWRDSGGVVRIDVDPLDL